MRPFFAARLYRRIAQLEALAAAYEDEMRQMKAEHAATVMNLKARAEEDKRILVGVHRKQRETLERRIQELEDASN